MIADKLPFGLLSCPWRCAGIEHYPLLRQPRATNAICTHYCRYCYRSPRCRNHHAYYYDARGLYELGENKAFEQQNNAKIEVLKSGDAGQALNKAALSKDAPLADVFFGVDNTFLTRAQGGYFCALCRSGVWPGACTI
ncbi:MAG: hypothetical protein U0074_05275 [Kouleothrix sp.]